MDDWEDGPKSRIFIDADSILVDPLALLTRAKPGKWVHDGVPLDVCWRTHEASQVITGVHQPKLNARDIHHKEPGDPSGIDPRVIAYETPRTFYEGRKQKLGGRKKGERPGKGSRTAKMSWHQQGTSVNDIIGPSKDMQPNTGRKMGTNINYFQATKELATFISEAFHLIFPSYYTRKTSNGVCG
ncbi:hypothetical protein B0H14DRAFT_3482801 [Mycena olivaceomarginata]|nr:hypothetical protein B0H14DRAFT_3482801 [Mycena olivaceomarginata]